MKPFARLMQLLVCDGCGSGRSELRPASWDEALERTAAGLGSAVAAHGPSGVGLFSCSKSTNEVNYLVGKFVWVVLGSNNVDSCNWT